ncbi:MAG TPA: S46 family peptidase [Gemmatimonadaceae bacterium]|nr:S46 family peptidase [Gemmatimonadaceae bacterium]
MDLPYLQENRMSLASRVFRPLASVVCPLTLVFALPMAAVAQNGHSAPSNGWVKEFGTMWTFDAPPLAYWKARYGFTADQGWLDHVRLSSIRIPGCSASFVSSAGLVMTNHHCGRDCTAGSSPSDSNYIETGFAAANLADEKKCANMYADQLQSITNVTDRVHKAVTATAPAKQVEQRNAEIDRIQRECAQQPTDVCEVVTFYQGGMYSLYKYHRWTDIRLVMAPEEGIAFYGGDPDNFTYPRYDLDLTLLRVYENGQPLVPRDFLKWSANGAAENDLVFVTGNPGSTGRLLTVAQMEYLRDVDYPSRLAGYDRLLRIWHALAASSPEAARRYQNSIFSYENSKKAVTGYRAGLLDSAIMARKRAFERDFRRRIEADPALRAKYGTAWDEIARAEKELETFARNLQWQSFGGGSSLLNFAGGLVRVPSQGALPDSARLSQYRGPGLDRIRAQVVSTPVDTAFERRALAATFAAWKEALPATDPALVMALAAGNGDPERAAAAIIARTTLSDTAARRALLAGGKAAVAKSTDPLIALARVIEPTNRRLAQRAAKLDAVISANAEKIGQAIFAAYGTSLPPDATFTLRITDGVVEGYPMNGTEAPYKTTMYGLYERATDFDNKPPFQLPERWSRGRDKVDLATPMDFVSTNDIIGGNSGSPVINRNAEVVGLIFDGNIESLPNRFIFTDDVARSVSVSSRAIVEALRKLYGADRIADELTGRQ